MRSHLQLQPYGANQARVATPLARHLLTIYRRMKKIFSIFLVLIGSCFGDSFTGDKMKIEYRGFNGAYSPDGRWYAQLCDGENKETKAMYFHFQLYKLTEHSRVDPKQSFNSKGKKPIVDILTPDPDVNVRGMNLFWSPESTTFTADHGRHGIFTYNLKTHNYSKTQK